MAGKHCGLLPWVLHHGRLTGQPGRPGKQRMAANYLLAANFTKFAALQIVCKFFILYFAKQRERNNIGKFVILRYSTIKYLRKRKRVISGKSLK
jgi:hypothetical protein